MATGEPGRHTAGTSISGPRPGGAPGHVARAAGPLSGRSGRGVLRLGERSPAAVEKRGPYMVMRVPSIQTKLQKHRDLAKAVLRKKGMLGASPNRPDSSGKRSVKFNKGYTALSQSPDENLVSLNSDRAVFFGALSLTKMACLADLEDSCCSWIWSISLVWENLKSYRPPCMLSTLPFAAVLHRHPPELTVFLF
ncbi:protein FAM219B isoform X2 [Pteronotus mesoamericanus]|uniref:protein FAM219B isoform X2 n=1 Tax=Pteronotus mesoamericanus TaxID=1884717 RepID=UPI0023EDB30E|nr:protein FAM219B isoform X2 [Pteronotus parnellii mesoamericanus]